MQNNDNNPVWRFNKGEWSEAYVLLRLIGDGIIYAGDEKSNKISNTYIRILSVLKRNVDNILECCRIDTNKPDPRIDCSIRFDNGKQERICFNAIDFSVLADSLISELKMNKEKAFPVPDVQAFLERLSCSSPKAAKYKTKDEKAFKGKTDIVIKAISSIDDEVSVLGYSIKSKVGSPPTLFNTAYASSFIYELDGCDAADFANLNSIISAKGHPDVIKRVKYIRNKGIKMRFLDTSYCNATKGQFQNEPGPHFRWNLELVDEALPNILSEALLIRYGYKGAQKTNCVKIVEELARLNPFSKRNPKVYYQTKMANFVYAVFGQMTASVEWDGKHIINGGYIEVLKNGDVLYYKANSDDQFKGYLLNNTKFESPSTNPKKGYNHGTIYKKDNRYYLSLNFSIRFK